MATNFDVWFVAADQVYKAVPYGVVTDWAEQGRLGADDKLRPAGVETTWVRAADHPQISDFLFVASVDTAASQTHGDALEPVELDGWHRRSEDEDDDVDMIPLIDISLVLLIFFMMTATVAALSPIDVPDMKHASELSKEADAITIEIDKRGIDEIVYAVRIGNAAAAPEDNNLASLGAMLTRLDARLAGKERPPEVRIACNKELPRERVREVAKELDQRKHDGQIAFYGAEVNEVTP